MFPYDIAILSSISEILGTNASPIVQLGPNRPFRLKVSFEDVPLHTFHHLYDKTLLKLLICK